MEATFTNWLKTGNTGIYSVEQNGSVFSALKVRKNDIFDYILCRKTLTLIRSHG